ncbi:right-handed parallel beta-helix repeat-containing protein [Peribacillus frigoritolerans]|uniref:hypothetical protein n=1 Tax=Peribacillus castrilensis TaxID=2897690 RepID=UPI003DA4BC14
MENPKGQINLADYPLIIPETSDSPRIQRALDALTEGDKFLLSGGELLITQPIVFKTRNIQISTIGKCTIKATASIQSCIKLESVSSESIQYGLEFDNIIINANNLADHCLLIGDTVGLYIAEIKVLRCKFSNALLDGVKVKAPAWVIKFNKCNSEYNGRDGIRVATNGSKQVNAVQIIDCVLSGNTGNGISMNGISHLIKGNVIEKNYYGISIDPSIDTSEKPSNAYKIIIEGNYIELNRQAEIFIKAYRSGQINGVSIKDNYFWSNVVGGSGTLIKCEGSLGWITSLTLKDNLFQIDGINVTKYFDGRNALNTDSDVGTIINTSTFINLGLAKSNWYSYKIIPILPKMIQNAEYDLTQKSENIMLLKTPKIVFGFPDELSNKLIRSINVYAETDSTRYVVRMKYVVKNLYTGTIVKQGSQDITKTGSSAIQVNIINAWGYERRTNSEYMYFEIELLNSTDGTHLYFHVPYIELSQ